MGTSSSLLEDDTLLIGSPGPYTWRGTIFTQDSNDDVLARDHDVYMAPVEDGASPVEKYSYLGILFWEIAIELEIWKRNLIHSAANIFNYYYYP